MTITYSENVFTSTGNYGIFIKLLLRWKGSIYKLVYRDLMIYVFLYSVLSITYRFALPEGGKIYFEKISLFCGNFATLIPVTFVLGFYVSLLVTRWWKQFETIPWPDSAAVWISTCIKGHDDRGRLMRRTIIRYINLCLILTFRLICLPVKKRFPTLQHLEDAGILQGRERQIFEKMDQDVSHPKYWMPLVWAGSIVTRARKENRIANDYMMLALIEQIDKFRGLAGGCINCDWVTIPLVYTQVVTLAVYTFLLSTLMGRQFLDPAKNYPGHEVDMYVPVFTILQFFFYMGWLKVAEALINPFGEDDDDFEANWMIDRNLQVSYLIVDEMHAEHPEMVRDQFWDDLYPELPYTAAAEETRTDPVIGGTANYEYGEQEFLPMSSSEEEEDEIEDAIGSQQTFKHLKGSQELAEVVITGGKNGRPNLGVKKPSPRRNSEADSVSVMQGSRRSSRTKPIKINPSMGSIKKGEFGSVLSVSSRPSRPLHHSTANSVSGVSLVSRLQNVIRGRGGGPGSVFGNSHISLMSKASRKPKRSRRPSGRGLGRSTSRVSNASQFMIEGAGLLNESAPIHGASDSDSEAEESMFKFSRSSMSSVDHDHHDLPRRRKKSSISSPAFSPRAVQDKKCCSKTNCTATLDGGQHTPIRRGSVKEQNQALVRKLELMHNFTTEAVRLLKTEEDLGNPSSKADDSQYLFRALEENHEELRRLLLKRLRPRPHRNSTISASIGSPSTACIFSSSLPNEEGQFEFDLTQPFDPSSSQQPACSSSSAAGAGQPAAAAAALLHRSLSKGSGSFQMEEENPTTNEDEDDEDDYDDDKSQVDTMIYNDNLSVQEDQSHSPLELDDSATTASTSEMDAEENKQPWQDLATIEEQPEPGYSSETENGGGATPFDSSQMNKDTLEPLVEEEDTKDHYDFKQ